MNHFLRRARIIPLLLIAFARPDPASAREPASAPAQSTPEWTVDDVLSAEWASSFKISPDCHWAVWIKSAPDKEKNEYFGIDNLFLSSLTDKKEIQLTRGNDGYSRPRWSPDGKLIAFLSSRSEPGAKSESKNRIWLINPFGGEPWLLPTGDRAVTDFDWAGANTIIYAAQEEKSLYEQHRKKKKDNTLVVEDETHEPPVRLFKIDLKTKKVTRITDNTDRIGDFWVSPDGTKAVTHNARSLRNDYDHALPSLIFLTDLKTGERKQIFADIQYHLNSVRWERDSRGLYLLSQFNNHPQYAYPSITKVYHYALADGAIDEVNLDWDNGLSSRSELEVIDRGFVTLLADGARSKPARYVRDGGKWQREWLAGIHATNLVAFEIGRDDRTFVYAYSDSARPSQYYRAKLDKANIDSPVQLTSLNAPLQKKRFAKNEIVHWPGALGESGEGVLHYPLDYQPGKKYPLIVDIHGGPAAVSSAGSWLNYIMNCEIWNARGAFVFRPNYHGSSNYGLKWTESIIGHLNELEVEDIEKGVDYLIGRGLADPEKLGVMGWSQGGDLTAAVTVATNRYKAAIAGDGPIDWLDYWAKSDLGGFFCKIYLGASPLDDPAALMQHSSFYRMNQVTTPTLILFGSEDHRVPVEQGWMYYRALQQTGKTSVRFLQFPGDGHGLAKLSFVKRTWEEELAWFDKYLFQNAREDELGLKPESPLAIALKLRGAKADGFRYGRMKNGCLIPETVPHGSLEIGRFEVTQAQFVEFDRHYTVARGRENFPANGISFDQAKAYCVWLSRTSGDHYRLPDASEADSLYGQSSAGENTLDYWAGGDVNPDDAEKIRTKTREFDNPAPLLKEVGSFKPAGDDPVFDLEGNVAEWTVASDGGGMASGASADTPADSKTAARHPAPEYIGLRVVKDADKTRPSK